MPSMAATVEILSGAQAVLEVPSDLKKWSQLEGTMHPLKLVVKVALWRVIKKDKK